MTIVSSLPNTQGPAADRCLSVRFEDSCVLIPPGPSRSALRPRIITKSYSLPLWKPSSPKKPVTFQSLIAEVNQEANAEAERKAFCLTVSVPSLTTKSRPRRSSVSSPSSCLSKRSLSHSQFQNSNTLPSSQSSLQTVSNSVAPSPVFHRPHSFPQIQPATTLKQAETIPLRPCCENCHSCVDASLAEGESWFTQWSKGAVRRYSEGEHVHLHAPQPSVFGVTHVWRSKNPCHGSSEGDLPLADALTIDEVDIKRRSMDYSQVSLNNHHVFPSSATEDSDTDDEEISREEAYTSPSEPLFKTANMQEEDEDMVFPLPSPRRTPNHSHNTTPTSSQVNLPTLHSGGQTDVALSGNQTIPNTPAISSPLVGQNSEPTPLLSLPPPISVTLEKLPFDPSTSCSPFSSPTQKGQRTSLPEIRRVHTQRRSSFSHASETFLKGSAYALKGVAASMKAGAIGGAILH